MPKTLELANELLAFGDDELQNMLIDLIEAKRQGLEVSKDFLYAVKTQLRAFAEVAKSSFEKQASKDAKQEESGRADEGVVARDNLLLLVRSASDVRPHNDHSPAPFPSSPRKTGQNIRSRRRGSSPSPRHARRGRLDRLRPRRLRPLGLPRPLERPARFGKEAREEDVNGLKLIAWYAYSPTDLKQFALQFTLLSQTMETLAEFVQGRATRTRWCWPISTRASRS